MRSKFDAGSRKVAKRKKRKRPPGGKALQRLFAFLGERDPALNDVAATAISVAKAARPKFGLTAQALRAKPRGGKSAAARSKRRAGRSPAQQYASAMAKAATSLTLGKAGARAVGRRALAAAGLAPAAPTWQFIGPSSIPNGQTYGTNLIAVSGRVSAIAVDPFDPKHLLVGAAGGGIWESSDTGANWAPRADAMPSLAIGAIAFDPKTPKLVYAGSGEGNTEYAVLGAGLYTSTDGGTTWSVLASTPFVGLGFYDLVVDPKDSSILYAATVDLNGQRGGFYKSINAGKTWSLKQAGTCWDISVHPGGGSVELLAAFNDGLFVSTNGGNTFSPVALPSGPAGEWTRLAVDRVRSNPDIAYAFGAAGDPDAPTPYLWRRAAATWQRITKFPAMDPDDPWTAQAWYDWHVAATPNNPGQVFLGAIDLFRLDLVGSSWRLTNISTQGKNSIHPDQHCLTFSPDNPKIIYVGSDGGIFRSANSGATWKALNEGLAITEIEYLATDPGNSKWVMAGTQDNGTLRTTGTPVWTQIAKGDGGDCAVDELDPDIIYHSFYQISLERSTNKGNKWVDLGLPSPPKMPSLWYPPVEAFGATVAIGGASLLVTRTGLPPWTTVPLGLAAREFPSAMRDVDANTILIGTTNGRMLEVSWTGTSWSKTSLASPSARYISCIAIDPSNSQRLWVTMSRIGGPLVHRSDDGGGSWSPCVTGLPPDVPMNAIVVDPGNFKRVWVAADMGVYQTLDLGATWTKFSNGLPNALAADLLFHKQDRVLICGTRNRGAWTIAVP